MGQSAIFMATIVEHGQKENSLAASFGLMSNQKLRIYVHQQVSYCNCYNDVFHYNDLGHDSGCLRVFINHEGVSG